MNLEKKIIQANKKSDLPSIQEIKSMPRGIELKIVFGEKLKSKRDSIGEKWQKKLPKFSIGIHSVKEEINISKLITDEEIIQNQDFFENCAKEYGELGEKLMKQFANEYEVDLIRGRPVKTKSPTGKKPYVRSGEMGNWIFSFHGIHLGLRNKETNQQIEIPLNYGEEYGELDPFFFSIFIRTTPKFKPLPVKIYDDFWDGGRILDVMLKIGKFEEIDSIMPKVKGVVVKNRIKKTGGYPVVPTKKENLSFWEKIKLKIKRRRTHNKA